MTRLGGRGGLNDFNFFVYCFCECVLGAQEKVYNPSGESKGMCEGSYLCVLYVVKRVDLVGGCQVS